MMMKEEEYEGKTAEELLQGEVDIKWKDGHITDYAVHGGVPCRIVKCR